MRFELTPLTRQVSVLTVKLYFKDELKKIAGLEPTIDNIKNCCLNQFGHTFDR